MPALLRQEDGKFQASLAKETQSHNKVFSYLTKQCSSSSSLDQAPPKLLAVVLPHPETLPRDTLPTPPPAAALVNNPPRGPGLIWICN